MRSRLRLMGLLVLGCLVASPSAEAAAAEDGGPAATVDGGDDGGEDADDGSGDNGGSNTAPLACDGALCDTTNGSSCAVVRGRIRGSFPGGMLLGLSVLVALGAARRRRALLSLGPLVVAGTFTPSVCAAANEDAHADVQPVPPPPAVDVTTHEEATPRRLLAIGWNPLPFLTLGTLSADVVIVPFDHHALVLSPMVGSQTTAPFWIYDDAGNPTQLPEQSFATWGGEVGYRYYGGTAGPRGLFLGSSLLLAAVKATAANGTVTDYGRFGIAIDGGFSALVADRVMLSLGAGLQYTATTKSIPGQQWPVDVYANGGLRPRVLATIGWAF